MSLHTTTNTRTHPVSTSSGGTGGCRSPVTPAVDQFGQSHVPSVLPPTSVRLERNGGTLYSLGPESASASNLDTRRQGEGVRR